MVEFKFKTFFKPYTNIQPKLNVLKTFKKRLCVCWENNRRFRVKSYSQPACKMIILGDFNIWLLKNSNLKNKYTDILNSCNFSQLIEKNN